MQIQVKLFAALRESVGASELTLDLPGAATVADAWTMIQQTYPQLQQTGSLGYAINRRYADLSQPLSDGDELALIPPVSGG